MKYLYLLMIAGILTWSSCVSHEQLLNFTHGPEFPDTLQMINNLPQLKIQPDDLLSIKVRALEPTTAAPFNIDPPNLVNVGAGGARPLLGFLVNREGTIDFPILGTLKVIGLTTGEVKDLLLEKLEPYLKEPVILVRFLNFRITVLGEVSQPGTYFSANERVTLLDMLGQAGDISPYGNRTNVLIIREQDGNRQTARLNLQDRNIFQSPFFYLQQNDVIYVEPLPTRTAAIRDQSQRLLPWLSALSALTTLAITLSRL